jgi:hypothetical protein
LGALISVFIEDYRVNRVNSSLAFARQLATNYLRENGGFLHDGMGNLSLFNGISGIGYLFLQLYSPLSIQSPLLPKLDVPKVNDELNKSINHKSIIDLFSKKIFPESIRLLGEDASSSISDINLRYFYKSLFVFIREEVGSRSKSALQKEVFRIESAIRYVDNKIFNNCFFYVRQLYAKEQSERFKNIDKAQYDSLKLSRDPYILTRRVSIEWVKFKGLDVKLNLHKTNYFILVNPLYNGVEISYIEDFTNRLLSFLSVPLSMTDLITVIAKDSGFEEDQRHDLHELVVSHILLLIHKCCLIVE